MARILCFCLLLFIPEMNSVAQSCGKPPEPPPGQNMAQWRQVCESNGGAWIPPNDCNFPTDWCHKKNSANTPTGIDPVELVNQLPAPRNMKEMGQELTLAVGVAGMNAFIQGLKDNAARAAAAQAERERQAELARQQALIKRRQTVRNLLNAIGGNSELQLVFDDSALGIKRSQQKPAAAKGYGINGLPGIYTGGSQNGNQGQDSGYGIKGLPGVYSQNGTSTTSAQVQNNNAPAAQPQGYGLAALPAPAKMNAQNAAPPAEAAANNAPPSAPPASSTAPANETVAQNTSPSQNGKATPQDAAPAQPATKVVAKDSPAMQQLQTVAANSDSAAQASSAEEAATKAGAGFDRADNTPPPVHVDKTASAPSGGVSGTTPASSNLCVGTADGAVNLRCAPTDVVDPQRVRLAAALVKMANKTNGSDRAAILDQALDTANGDGAISAQSNALLPEVSAASLHAFQQANAMYRQATDLHVRAQERFNEAQHRRELAVEMLGPWYRQVAEIEKAQLQGLPPEKAHAMLAEVLAGVRQEDEAMHMASERLVYADLDVDRARFDAEHALAAGSNAALQPASLDDVKFLFPLIDPALASEKELDSMFSKAVVDEFNFRTFISPAPEMEDVDLLFPPEPQNLRYADMDGFWKQHPSNVQHFMNDEGFRQSARAYWQKVVDDRERQYKDAESQYARRVSDYVREHGLPRNTNEQQAMAATMRTFAKDRNDRLRASSEQATHDWTGWLDHNERSAAAH
jgi:hypothetical protein